jgi:cytochrome b pre-mRNA-processing protein 3
MIFPLFRRHARQDTISILYGTIVAQARLPCFYREYGVPDTINGRFDLLVLHLIVVLDRLGENGALRDLGQGIFDLFCKDMDDNLREMGVGDLSVPKEMQRIGEAFYGRAQAYRTALAAPGEDALAAALQRNIYSGAPYTPGAPARLAAYIREAVRDVRAQARAGILGGKLHLPDPSAAGVFVEDKGSRADD